MHVRWRRLPAARRLVEPRVHQVPARARPPVARRGQVDGGEPEDERANARPHPPGALRVDALRRVCGVLVPVRVPAPAAKPQIGRECERSRPPRPPRAEAVATLAAGLAAAPHRPPADAPPPTPAAASASYALAFDGFELLLGARLARDPGAGPGATPWRARGTPA